MKRPLQLALFAILAYGAFIVMQLPARLLLDRWQPPAEWQVHEPQGSVWCGEIRGLYHQGRDLGSLKWQFKPSRLLLGEVAVDWQWSGPYGEADGIFGRSLIGERLGLRDLTLNVDMDIAEDLGWSPLALVGRLDGRLEQIAWHPEEGTAVAGRLQWQNAAIGSRETLSLGQVRLWPGDQARSDSLILDNQPGDVRLQGELRFPSANQIELSLTLQPVNTRGRTAIKLLGSVATVKPDGGAELLHRWRLGD